MKKFNLEKNTRREKFSGIFVGILIGVVVMLSIIQVLIANRLVEASEKLRTLDREIVSIQNDNQTLAESLRSPRSLTFIEQQAKIAGFVKSDKVVFLAAPAPVAYLR